jgi:hypothetical protein
MRPVNALDFVCEACGKTFPIGELRTWRQEELVQAAQGASALSVPGAIRSRGLTPVTRSVYTMREYRLCPDCLAEVSEPIEQDLEYQRRGVLVVGALALGAMPIPYTNPLPTIPTAGN